MKIELSRDRNGNKIVRFKPDHGRGFSVQTLGNMPRTHRDFDASTALSQLVAYVRQHGTDKPKDAIGL